MNNKKVVRGLALARAAAAVAFTLARPLSFLSGLRYVTGG